MVRKRYIFIRLKQAQSFDFAYKSNFLTYIFYCSNQIMKLLTETKSNSTVAQRIDLYFRDTKHAQIADLKIKFKRTGKFSKKSSKSSLLYLTPILRILETILILRGYQIIKQKVFEEALSWVGY